MIKINNDRNKNIFLMDGTLYLYRSYYKFLNLFNSKNILISVIQGMIYIINKIINNYNPKYLLIIYDYPCKNFRKISYNEYKKNRSSCPKDLINQIPIVNEIINNMGILTISIPSVESDDIIGTLSKQCKRNGFNVYIITIDKDMIQLMSKKVHIFDILSNKIFNPNDIYLKYNVNYYNIIDYFSLVGDSSDNIPGIYGIGPKTASILIQKYKNIYNIYKNINEIYNIKNLKNPKKIIKNLCKNKKKLMLFYNLIKIKTDIFIGYKINDFIIKNKNILNLNKLLKKYEILDLY
ncbi:DNA polymerase I [endosymbiont of Euscepes postfasciatus]|uniref:5'-3' exonuclease n=1 Tax=endosymbiont of Euscepes postfasciatus TaxID=650377 RepID=UPI000DC6F373|nr:5'-3' exonuclease H3TH domain-containing protein [endosymbiont of Euscepes postfasciatus]BBA84565.1 DNA polymerase I [endosymbiont of Euscepes postfasciatus]